MRTILLGFLAVLLAAPHSAQAQWQRQAPLVNRLDIRHTDNGGFSLSGMVGSVDHRDRFYLRVGTSAEQLRGTMNAIAWDETEDHTRDPIALLRARREIRSGAEENVEVLLDKPDGRVARIRYVVSPQQYSRIGLVRYLRRYMGKGRLLENSERAVEALYTNPDETESCHVQATRVSDSPPQWRLQYTMSSPLIRRQVTAAGGPESESPEGRGLEWKEPLSEPATRPSGLEWKTTEDLDWKRPTTAESEHTP